MSKKYRVLASDLAELDLLDITNHIVRDNPEAALRWLDEAKAKIDSLERFPERAPIIPETEELGRAYRHILHGDYRVIFRIEDDLVLVLRVLHGSRLLDERLLAGDG